MLEDIYILAQLGIKQTKTKKPIPKSSKSPIKSATM